MFVDVLDREWAGGAGELWCSVGGADWTRVFRDAAWSRPFVSVFADVASVVAMSVDGGVLECRPERLREPSWKPSGLA